MGIHRARQHQEPARINTLIGLETGKIAQCSNPLVTNQNVLLGDGSSYDDGPPSDQQCLLLGRHALASSFR
jgi:hypothetical protein